MTLAVRFKRGRPYAVAADPVVAHAFHRAFQLLDPAMNLLGQAPTSLARVEAVWETMAGLLVRATGPQR